MSKKNAAKLEPPMKLGEGEWLKELKHIENEVIHLVDIFNFLSGNVSTRRRERSCIRRFQRSSAVLERPPGLPARIHVHGFGQAL